MSELQLRARHTIISHPEYHAQLDDFSTPAGEQMVLMHIDVDHHKFGVATLKRLLDEWGAFRSVTEAPLYGIEPTPDDRKWERFVSLLGFKNTNSRVDCSDGQSRRLFVSLPKKDFKNERQQHAAAVLDKLPVERPDSLPH